MAADKRPDDFQARLDGFAQRSGCGPAPARDPDSGPEPVLIRFAPARDPDSGPEPVLIRFIVPPDPPPGSDSLPELWERTLNVMPAESFSRSPSPAFDAARERLVARARETLYELHRQVRAAHHEGPAPDPEEPRDAGKPIPSWRKTAIAAGLSAVSARLDDRDPDLER